LDATLEKVGLKPVRHLIESVSGVLVYHKLVVSGLEHPQTVLLVQVDATPAKEFLGVAGVADPHPGASLAVAIFKQVFIFVSELYFGMSIRKIRALDVHC
jgi:hypothetical protein